VRENDVAETPERLGRLEQRMERVEEGVANFRDFQATARDFFSRADERAIREKLFHETRDKEIKEAIEAADKKRNDAIADRERRFTHLIAIAGLLFTLMLVGIGWLTFRDMRRTSMEQAPAVRVSSSQQNAGGTETPLH
jgi:hypothetical protein